MSEMQKKAIRWYGREGEAWEKTLLSGDKDNASQQLETLLGIQDGYSVVLDGLASLI